MNELYEKKTPLVNTFLGNCQDFFKQKSLFMFLYNKNINQKHSKLSEKYKKYLKETLLFPKILVKDQQKKQ